MKSSFLSFCSNNAINCTADAIDGSHLENDENVTGYVPFLNKEPGMSKDYEVVITLPVRLNQMGQGVLDISRKLVP